jgi:hypothetical protein
VVRRSPQEKKALSYARDRRNDYGENDKSSRKNIRRSKKRDHRTSRHRENQVLGEAARGLEDTDLAEHAETALLGRRRLTWRKYRDAPLGETVVRKLRRRAEQGFADMERVNALIERIHGRTRRTRSSDAPRPDR